MTTTETSRPATAPPARTAGTLRSDVAPRTLARAAQIVFAKATVSRKQPAVLRDLAEYQSPDFRYDTTSLERAFRRIETVPPNSRGMRWVHSRDAVLFYAERDLDYPYDEFVSRVDISKVGLMFRDVLGITTKVVTRDDAGRTTLQLERIAALTQPNYSAFLGKDELDVYKLERMDYSPDEQRNWMRTVHSPNRSAICDDGYLAFVRVEGGTRVTFFACQHFPYPRLMAMARMDRWTWLKKVLTETTYRRFFDATMDNIQAGYEGREFGIGRRHKRAQAPAGRALQIPEGAAPHV
jgi:hypothetical protein